LVLFESAREKIRFKLYNLKLQFNIFSLKNIPPRRGIHLPEIPTAAFWIPFLILAFKVCSNVDIKANVPRFDSRLM